MNWEPSAKALATARLNDIRLDEPPRPDPQTLAEAYELQQAVTDALGFEVVGWKVGATNPSAQATLGAAEPFVGPIFRERTYESGASIKTAPDALRITEPEYAFRLRRGLPPRAADYGSEETNNAIESVHPVIEVINMRLAGKFPESTIYRLIADGGVSHAFVYGSGSTRIDPDGLVTNSVTATVNEMTKATGSGANVMDSPLSVLNWLANHMSKRGIGLKAGQWVSTGVTTDIFQVRRGDTVKADFENLGSVAVTFQE